MIRPAVAIVSVALSFGGLASFAQEARPILRPHEAQGATTPDSASAIDAQVELLDAAIEVALEVPNLPPPLSAGTISQVASAIQACWNVGSLSRSARSTTIIVAMEMNPNGRPVSDSIRLVKSSNEDAATTAQAYEAARRAILRCGSGGLKLALEQYERWKTIELTFNPQSM
jgi:hypothetical protein